MITIDISVKLAKYFDDRLISEVLENIEFAGGLLTFKYDANEDCFTKKVLLHACLQALPEIQNKIGGNVNKLNSVRK